MLSYDIFNNILDNLHPEEIIRLLFVLKNKALIDTIDWNYLNKKYNYNKGDEKGFKKFINCRKINIETVKQNGYALKYVLEQDKEICMEAVKQNGFLLKYVKELNKEICMEAIKQNG
jgi:hypothetical protein